MGGDWFRARLFVNRRALAAHVQAGKKMNVVSTSSGEHYRWGEDCDGWYLLKRDDISIIQELVPAGKGEVRHFHNISRQFFYILSGTATMQIGDDTLVLNRGEGVEIPPGVEHQFQNKSDEDVCFLVISFPKSHGDRVIVE